MRKNKEDKNTQNPVILEENLAESSSFCKKEEDSSNKLEDNEHNESTVENHELVYDRASIPKRLSSNLLDSFLSLVLGFILLALTFHLFNNSDYIQGLVLTRNTIAVESGLYEFNDDETSISRANVSITNNTELTTNEKIDELYDILYTFYLDDSFFDDGETLFYTFLESAIDEDGNYLYDEDYQRVFTNADYDEVYLDFFNDLFDYSTAYLTNNSEYYSASRTYIVILFFSIVTTMLIPFIIFYYVIPMCFVKTRQTLGGLLTKTAIINYTGLAVSWKKFTLRFLFMFIFEIFLSIFAFLTPLIISFTMLMLSKSHQNLHDYLFSTYCIDITDATVYKNIYQFKLALDNKEKSLTLTDKEYKPHIPER